MPPGIIHEEIFKDKGWYIFYPIFIEIGLMFIFPSYFLELTYLVLGTCFGMWPLALYLDSDADQVNITKSEGRVLKLAGKKPNPKRIRSSIKNKGLRSIHLTIQWMFFGLNSVRFFLVRIFVWLWLSILLLYGMNVKHRSWISHSYILSTAIRLVYMWFMLGIIISGLLSKVYLDMWMQALFSPFGLGVFIGLSVADVLHIMADYGRIELTKYEAIVKGKKRGR